MRLCSDHVRPEQKDPTRTGTDLKINLKTIISQNQLTFEHVQTKCE